MQKCYLLMALTIHYLSLSTEIICFENKYGVSSNNRYAITFKYNSRNQVFKPK